MSSCLQLRSFIRILHLRRRCNTRQLVSKLANILDVMVQLESLYIVIPEDHTDLFEAEFRKAGLHLSNVKSLTVGPFME